MKQIVVSPEYHAAMVAAYLDSIKDPYEYARERFRLTHPLSKGRPRMSVVGTKEIA